MIEKLKEQRKYFKQEHKKNELIMQASANLQLPPDKDLIGRVKSLYLKRSACTKKIDHLQSTKWWLTHHIRGNCRRIAVIKGAFYSSPALSLSLPKDPPTLP
jgi:hypothetical protein